MDGSDQFQSIKTLTLTLHLPLSDRLSHPPSPFPLPAASPARRGLSRSLHRRRLSPHPSSGAASLPLPSPLWRRHSLSPSPSCLAGKAWRQRGTAVTTHGDTCPSPSPSPSPHCLNARPFLSVMPSPPSSSGGVDGDDDVVGLRGWIYRWWRLPLADLVAAAPSVASLLPLAAVVASAVVVDGSGSSGDGRGDPTTPRGRIRWRRRRWWLPGDVFIFLPFFFLNRLLSD